MHRLILDTGAPHSRPSSLQTSFMIREYVYRHGSVLLVSEVEGAFEGAGRVRGVM